MKRRRLAVVVLVFAGAAALSAALASAAPAPVEPVTSQVAPVRAPSGSSPAAAVPPEVVDDPCLPDDPSCSAVEAPAVAPLGAQSTPVHPPASRAVAATPSRGASADGAHTGGPVQRPAADETVAPPATDSPMCDPNAIDYAMPSPYCWQP